MIRRAVSIAFESAITATGLRDQCSICGAPEVEGRMHVVIEKGMRLPRCPGCGRPIDGYARPVGYRGEDGSLHFTTVVMPRESVGADALGPLLVLRGRDASEPRTEFERDREEAWRIVLAHVGVDVAEGVPCGAAAE